MTKMTKKPDFKKSNEELNLFLNPLALIVSVMLTYVMNSKPVKA